MSGLEQLIPKGFIQTEVGVIPKDWDIKTLGEISGIERGKFSARPRNDPKFFGGSVPFIQTGDITRSNGKNVTYSQTLNARGVSVSRIFPANSLYFTIAANIGDVAIVNYQSACPDSLVVIKEKQNIDKGWLYHSLTDKKSEFEVIATSNAQLNINLEKLNPYKLSIPPLKEQTTIANALSDVDALLTELEKLITKKQAIKTATMQQLLTGKTRLPQFATFTKGTVGGKSQGQPKGTKPSELGEIPEDWDVFTLGELSELTSSKRIFESDYVNDGVPFYRGQEISSLLENKEIGNVIYISKRKYSELKARYGAPKPGEILITAVGTLGNALLIKSEEPFYFKDGNLIWVRKINNCSPQYLINQLNYNKKRVLDCAIGSSQKALTMVSLSPLAFAIPESFKEQTAIATILSDMDNEIQTLEQRLAKTRQIKQGMMQQLLTGRTRLPFDSASKGAFEGKQEVANAN